jgi:hypothetical protein
VPVEVVLAKRRSPDGTVLPGREKHMKKMIVAGMLALAMTAVAQQEASAWCRFNFNTGINISYESTGCCYGWAFYHKSNPPPCGYGYPSPYCGYYGGYSPYGYAAVPQAVPAAPAVMTAPAQTQQAGYYFYGQGYTPSYGYGY